MPSQESTLLGSRRAAARSVASASAISSLAEFRRSSARLTDASGAAAIPGAGAPRSSWSREPLAAGRALAAASSRPGLKPGKDKAGEAQEEGRDAVLDVMGARARLMAGEETGQPVR